MPDLQFCVPTLSCFRHEHYLHLLSWMQHLPSFLLGSWARENIIIIHLFSKSTDKTSESNVLLLVRMRRGASQQKRCFPPGRVNTDQHCSLCSRKAAAAALIPLSGQQVPRTAFILLGNGCFSAQNLLFQNTPLSWIFPNKFMKFNSKVDTTLV